MLIIVINMKGMRPLFKLTLNPGNEKTYKKIHSQQLSILIPRLALPSEVVYYPRRILAKER
jgi:hypothetical protein